jgi:hypothetical protein
MPAVATPKLTPWEARLRKRLLPWIRHELGRVGEVMNQAHAHAENAVTQTLKKTKDGRASAARIRLNPSFQAALRRLSELQNEIGGPTVTSLSGLVQDAAESFYRDARQWYADEVPAEHQGSTAITAAQVAYVRGLLWYHKPIRLALQPKFVTIRNDLIAALGAAGSTTSTKRVGTDALQTWEQTARWRLGQEVGAAMADLNVAADRQAMKDTMKPELAD